MNIKKIVTPPTCFLEWHHKDNRDATKLQNKTNAKKVIRNLRNDKIKIKLLQNKLKTFEVAIILLNMNK
tara:strand:+ start:136 stop:342 length:207 start_codon:yes stop_codon:yes gene_type:complete